MTTVHQALAIGAAVLGLAAAAADRPAVDPAALAAEIVSERDHITAPELAERIMGQDASLHVIDLRPRADYDAFHIPTAAQAPLETLARQAFPRGASIVLYSEGSTQSAQGWVLLRLRGERDVRFLREGMYEWLARVMEPRLATDATDAERQEFARAEAQSRFFGGQPRSNMPRAEVPVGYWSAPSGPTGPTRESAGSAHTADAIRATVGAIRRRGC
jgi:rhodanese-related sulfurtransferase